MKNVERLAKLSLIALSLLILILFMASVVIPNLVEESTDPGTVVTSRPAPETEQAFD